MFHDVLKRSCNILSIIIRPLIIYARGKPHGIGKICKTLFYDVMSKQKQLFFTWDQEKILANLMKLGLLLRFTRSRKTFCSNKLSWQAKDEYHNIYYQSNCPFLRDYTQFVFTCQSYILIIRRIKLTRVHSLGYVHTFSMMLIWKDF